MKYFGTDGIRGKAYDFINQEMSFLVGKSLKIFTKEYKTLIISRDTRESGEMIVENIKKGALLAGLDVYDIGVYATPILAFASETENSLGVMVTASHNPYQDNGIKIFKSGLKLHPEDEELIEEIIDNDIDLSEIKPGKEIEINGLIDRYFNLYESFNQKNKLNIALDLANGATIKSALKTLPDFVNIKIIIGDKPDGLNINKNCGSTHLENLQSLVKDNHLDLGIAFDGDGDRILVIDDLGEVVDGDLLIYIFAKYLKANNLLSNDLVVLSKMSNIGIIKALKTLGIETIQTDVGDKYIIRAMEDYKASIGGENSGHIINKTLLNTGDGVLNAYYLLKILDYYKVSLSDYKKEVKFYPDKLVNIKNIDKNLVNDKDILALVEKHRKSLGEDGKILVRASGTEPLVRVSVSAKNQEIVDNIIAEILNAFENKKKGE